MIEQSTWCIPFDSDVFHVNGEIEAGREFEVWRQATSSCGLLQGCIYQVDVRRDPSGYELLPTMLGDMIAAGLRPNKATHALFCEAYLMEELAEVCQVLGGLAIADEVTRLWMICPFMYKKNLCAGGKGGDVGGIRLPQNRS